MRKEGRPQDQLGVKEAIRDIKMRVESLPNKRRFVLPVLLAGSLFAAGCGVDQKSTDMIPLRFPIPAESERPESGPMPGFVRGHIDDFFKRTFRQDLISQEINQELKFYPTKRQVIASFTNDKGVSYDLYMTYDQENPSEVIDVSVNVHVPDATDNFKLLKQPLEVWRKYFVVRPKGSFDCDEMEPGHVVCAKFSKTGSVERLFAISSTNGHKGNASGTYFAYRESYPHSPIPDSRQVLT